ncbi:MAG: glutaredoxin family protein [Candidatus Saccharimonadales bacterium]
MTNSQQASPANAGHAVVIYSSPTCAFCHMAKEYFDQKGISYTDRDVSVDQEALMYIVNTVGQAVTPIITIGDKVIVGFDRQKIDEALADKVTAQ